MTSDMPYYNAFTNATARLRSHGLSRAVSFILTQQQGAGKRPTALVAAARDPSNGCTALHAAAANGHEALASLLAGVWPQGLFDPDARGRRPVEAAAARGHTALASMLWRRRRLRRW